MADIKATLRPADGHLREARYTEAVDEYQAAADAYIAAGFALKAAAVLRQIVEISERSDPAVAAARTRALRGLLGCYTDLGLTTDADEVRRLLN